MTHPSPMRATVLASTVFLIFLASGAAGLVYESIWSRYLGLFVGHAAYAQLLVLSIFLGGMAAGAAWVGARSRRFRRPLLAYAVIELVVGIAGLLFHPLFVGVTDLAYGTLLPGLASERATALKWTLAALLILPQSVLLGMTFPLMSAGLLRLAPAAPGRAIALLYFANSLGGAIGVLAAGFVLIEAFGLPGTVQAAALLNGVAALGAFALHRRVRERSAADTGDESSPRPFVGVPSEAPRGPAKGSGRARRLAAGLLAVAFLTAVASFLYEIAWIRMLSLVLGSATHSFELMLSAFILGIALGSAWVRRRIDAFASPLRALGIVQAAMGAAALATIPVYLASFGWMATWLDTFQKSAPGYCAFNAARYLLCMAVMLPSTFFAGMTLPLLTKILVVRGPGERAVGIAYGVNTLGSITGVVLAGAVLLPAIGLRGTLLLGGAIDLLLGAAVLVCSREGRRIAGLVLAGAAALVLVTASARFDRRLLTSGVYRRGVVPDAQSATPLFYRDGRTATVSATRHADGSVSLATNGKPDASLPRPWFEPPDERVGLAGDDSTQVLSALVSLAHRPDARRAAIVGHGSGMTSHFVLASSVLEDAVTIEIEPVMIEGSRVFRPSNRRPFEDERSRFVIDDARAVLASGSRGFDLILSEPSNPWVSGVAGLFTTEFYARVAAALDEGGVFGQWIHLYEMTDALVLSVLAAIHEHFADYAIYLLNADDMLIVASRTPLGPPDASVFGWPAVAADLDRFDPVRGEHVRAMRILDREALAPLLDRYEPTNSDFRPVLDLGAERARYLGLAAQGIRSFAIDRFDLATPRVGRPPLSEADRTVPVPGHPRLEARARALRLREHWSEPLVRGAPDGATGEARYRVWRLRGLLEARVPPGDWTRFVREALTVEALLDGGTAGERFEPFFAELEAFLDATAAPGPARAAVALTGAWALGDYSSMIEPAQRLLDEAAAGRTWLPVDLLLDGAVLAYLETGDASAARALERTHAGLRRRGPRDLRAMLLRARLEAAGR